MIWNYAASEFKGWAKEWNSYYIQLSEFFIASIPYSWSVYDNKGKVWKQYIQKYRIRKKKNQISKCCQRCLTSPNSPTMAHINIHAPMDTSM